MLFLGMYYAYYLSSESSLCIKDPYLYGSKILSMSNNADVSCSCTLYNGTQQYPVIRFTQDEYINN